MQGFFLKIYVGENQKLGGVMLSEWLLEQAKKIGIQGGSAFRAVAGFGRHGMMHEETFFELAGSLPVEVGFVVSEEQSQQLLASLKTEKLKLFYVKIAAEYGVTGEA